jgi:hypothetical protein
MDDNFLNNGAVLPYGLLGNNVAYSMGAFNKSYKNTAIRMGIVARAYATTDEKNLSKLTTEYDVLVFEQNEDLGSSIVTYRNCIYTEGLGSIADYFEKNLRVRTTTTTPSGLIDTKGQNGAVVLIECLDGMSDKALIVGSITHPDRTTNLTDTNPYLEGEYNGVNVVVNEDGSTALTFKGATNSFGVPIDPAQGDTTIQIETDGSFQVSHSTITFSLSKTGTVSLTTKEDVNVTASGNINFQITGDATINVDGDIDATAGGSVSVSAGTTASVTSKGTSTVNAKTINLASGSVNIGNGALLQLVNSTFQTLFDAHVHLPGEYAVADVPVIGISGPPTIPMTAANLTTNTKAS